MIVLAFFDELDESDMRTLMLCRPSEPTLATDASQWCVITDAQIPAVQRLLARGIIERAPGMPDGWYRLALHRAGEVAA